MPSAIYARDVCLARRCGGRAQPYIFDGFAAKSVDLVRLGSEASPEATDDALLDFVIVPHDDALLDGAASCVLETQSASESPTLVELKLKPLLTFSKTPVAGSAGRFKVQVDSATFQVVAQISTTRRHHDSNILSWHCFTANCSPTQALDVRADVGKIGD